MALVENIFPDELSSVYRPICWKFTTDSVNVVKLKVEHFIDSTLVATTYALPDLGTTDEFTINGSGIASNFVSYDISDEYRGVSYSMGSENIYNIEVTELDATGIEFLSLTGTSIGIENIPLQHSDSQNIDQFKLIDSSSCFLSKRPQISTIYRGEFIPFNIISDGIEDVNYVIEIYSGVVSINIIQDYLNNTLSFRGTQYIDTSLVFFDNADRFTLTIYDDSFLSTQTSKTYTFNIKENCDHKEVHFLNCLGAMDSFMFTGDSETKDVIKRKRFKGSIGKNFDLKDRGQSILGTKAVREITLYSRFLNNAEADMLSDLIHSPLVFIIENDKYVPVVVKDGSFTTKSSKGLIQYKVVLQYSNNKIVNCV